MSLESLLAADTLIVEQPAATVDDSGGFVAEPWAPFASAPGRVEPLDGKLMEFYAAQGMLVSHQVYTQQDGIRQGYRVTTSDGLYLLVVSVGKERQLGTISTYYEILTRQVQL